MIKFFKLFHCKDGSDSNTAIQKNSHEPSVTV
jgi:hypothetical protein